MMILLCLLFFNLTNAFFINKLIQQGSPFLIKHRELKKEIKYNHTDLHPYIKNVSGFYGLIGPDIDMFSIKTLYDLFTGDGMIQGVFLDKGNITFVKHIVRTEKILYEEQYGRFSKKFLMTLFYLLLNKMNMLPNVLGLANTALLDIGSKTLALFERDLPYEIKIDFEKKQLKTLQKIKIDNLEHFSGHSKNIESHIHTIDYDVIKNRILYIVLNHAFEEIHRTCIKTTYIPILHDFAVLKNGLLFIDSPFVWSPFSKIPVTLSNQSTYIHVCNTYTNMRVQYECILPFYLFHYANIVETEKSITIYGSHYEELDFSSLYIQGKYRKIVVNKISGEVFIIKNNELESMNLDFPLQWKEYVLLRSISNQTIHGFVLCRGLDIIKKINMPNDRFFCGEPSIIEIDGSPFLIGFAYDSFENGYLILFELFHIFSENNKTEKYIEIVLDTDIKLTIGFHSIFLHH